MTADQILTALAPLGIHGVSILDPADPATWTFTPDLPEQRAQAEQIVSGLLPQASSPPVSDFWAVPITPLEQDVKALKAKVGL
jgi:hypothetical protein